MKFSKSILFSALVLGMAFTAQAGQYPDLPVGVKNGGGALIGDTLYVGLGSAGDKIFALDLKNSQAQWKEIVFPGGERNQPVLNAVDGKLYVLGGMQKNDKGEIQIVNDAYSYNPMDNSWSKLPTRSPHGLVGVSSATHQDKIYFFGGVNDNIFNGYFQDYTAAGGDKEKQKMVADPYFMQRPQDYFFSSELFSYQPSTNKWYNEGHFPFAPRAGAAFAIDGNKLLVVNGEIKPGLRTAATAQGDMSAKGVTWKALPDLPAPKGQMQDGLAGAMGGFSHGYYLVTGGANFPGSVKQFEQGNLYAHQGLSKAWHKDVYALDKGKWKIVGELPMNIGYGVGLTYQDKVLLIGGETDGGKALTTIQTMSYDGKKLTVE